MEKKPGKPIFKIIIIILLILVLCSCCGATIWMAYLIGNGSEFSQSPKSSQELDYDYSYGNASSKNNLLSIPIKGIILDTKPDQGGFLSLISQEATYGYDVKDQLYKASKDNSIKGIILEISSPGGTISGANAISEGVKYFRDQTGKPVIAHVMGMAASGAYWSASSTDLIIADAGSLSGSIGVIFGPFQEYNTVLGLDTVLTKDGIDEYYITGGGSKDVGNPLRKMTIEEKDLLQKGIDNEYNIFVDFVAQRRNIPAKTIKENIKASIYDNQKAIELKLIDESGSLDYAYQTLATKAGVESDFQIVKIKSDIDFWSSIFSRILTPSGVNALNQKSTSSCQNLCHKPVVVYGDPQLLDR